MNLVNVGIAFGAGVVSITSPCTVPLLPGYVGFLSGLSTGDVAVQRRRAFSGALLFVAGFTAVFAALGATATALAGLLLGNRPLLYHIAGAFIAIVGVVLLVSNRIPMFMRSGDWSRRVRGGQLWSAAPLGAAFAITWTPCIGPVLAGILALSAATSTEGEGVLLMVLYSLGLALPFLALSLSVPRVHGWLRRFRRGIAALRITAGLLLVGMGVLLLTDRWVPLMAPLLRLYAKAQWPPV